jgi:hypothetical protein
VKLRCYAHEQTVIQPFVTHYLRHIRSMEFDRKFLWSVSAINRHIARSQHAINTANLIISIMIMLYQLVHHQSHYHMQKKQVDTAR